MCLVIFLRMTYNVMFSSSTVFSLPILSVDKHVGLAIVNNSVIKLNLQATQWFLELLFPQCFFFLFLFFLFNVYKYLSASSIHAPCVSDTCRAQKSCAPSCGCRESNLGPLKGQQILLTAESSL